MPNKSNTARIIELLEEQNRLLREAGKSSARAAPTVYASYDVRCSKCDMPCMVDTRGGSVEHILLCSCNKAEDAQYGR